MDAYHNRYAAALRIALEGKEIELMKGLVSAMAPDHASYTERVGVIRGLRQALQAIEDVERDMSRAEEKEAAPETGRRQSYES